MDEIFGKENFKNEIIWAYPAASAKTRRFFIRSFDSILFYTKSSNYTFNDDPNIYMEFSDRVKFALKSDDKGTYYHRGGSHNGKKLSNMLIEFQIDRMIIKNMELRINYILTFKFYNNERF